MLNKPVSYELAVLAKEKGFDEDLNAFYNADKELEKFLDGWEYRNSDFAAPWFVENHPNGISAPTLDELTFWLRNVHGHHVQIDFFCCKDFGDRYHWTVIAKNIKNEYGDGTHFSEAIWDEAKNDVLFEQSYSLYEDAQEIGLRKGLSLIP